MDDASGQFGFVVSDGQGTEGQAAVANLIPVVFGIDPPVVRAEGGIETFFNDGGADTGFAVVG